VLVFGSLVSALFICFSCSQTSSSVPLTLKEIEEDGGVRLDDLAFLNHQSKNYVYRIIGSDAEKIAEYYDTGFSVNSFSGVVGHNLVDSIEFVGCPTFFGLADTLSLDFSCPDGNVRRIFMNGKNDDMVISNVDVLDKSDPASWVDPEKVDFPTLEECKNIVSGMYIDDVIKGIGKPQREVGSGVIMFEFDIKDGTTMQVTFHNDNKQEEELASSGGVEIYGTHFLYVSSVYFVD